MSGEHVAEQCAKMHTVRICGLPDERGIMQAGNLCLLLLCCAGLTADNIHRFTKSSKLQQSAGQDEGTGVHDEWQVPSIP